MLVKQILVLREIPIWKDKEKVRMAGSSKFTFCFEHDYFFLAVELLAIDAHGIPPFH